MKNHYAKTFVIISLQLIVLYSFGQRDAKTYNLAQSLIEDSIIVDFEDLTLNTSFVKLAHDFYQDSLGQLYIKTFSLGLGTGCIFFAEVPPIDVESFNDLGFYYTDKYYVYVNRPTSCGNQVYILDSADVESFKLIDPQDCWAMDNKTVYYMGTKLDKLNSQKTSFLNSSGPINYVKDENYVYYYSSLIKDADAKTFEIVNSMDYDAHDNQNKYKDGRVVK